MDGKSRSENPLRLPPAVYMFYLSLGASVAQLCLVRRSRINGRGGNESRGGRDYIMGTKCEHGSVAAELDALIGKVLAGNSWQTGPRGEWELALRGHCVLASMCMYGNVSSA